MLDAGKMCKSYVPGFHFFVTNNETGKFDSYNSVTNITTGRETESLSLIYNDPEKIPQPIIKQEINILEKRISDELIAIILIIEPTGFCFKQELFGAYLNSNNLPKMRFSAFGNAESVN